MRTERQKDGHFSVKIRRWCCGLVVAMSALRVDADPFNLRLAVLESVVGYPPYAMLNQGLLEGEVTEVFNCVANREGVSVHYEVLPVKRGVYDLRTGRLDALLPMPVVEGLYHHWESDVVFSEILHQGYWTLIHKADVEVDVEPPFDENVNIGMYFRAAYHELFGDVKRISVHGNLQMYRLLVSDRVNLISVFHPWPEDEVEHYAGFDLKAHVFRESPYRMAISRKSGWAEPQVLDRLNKAILACRHGFNVVANNPFRKPPAADASESDNKATKKSKTTKSEVRKRQRQN